MSDWYLLRTFAVLSCSLSAGNCDELLPAGPRHVFTSISVGAVSFQCGVYILQVPHIWCVGRVWHRFPDALCHSSSGLNQSMEQVVCECIPSQCAGVTSALRPSDKVRSICKIYVFYGHLTCSVSRQLLYVWSCVVDIVF